MMCDLILLKKDWPFGALLVPHCHLVVPSSDIMSSVHVFKMII